MISQNLTVYWTVLSRHIVGVHVCLGTASMILLRRMVIHRTWVLGGEHAPRRTLLSISHRINLPCRIICWAGRISMLCQRDSPNDLNQVSFACWGVGYLRRH